MISRKSNSRHEESPDKGIGRDQAVIGREVKGRDNDTLLTRKDDKEEKNN